MMVKVKGCANDNCIAHKKKVTYKETEEYCSRCGHPLSYVCKKCYTSLDERGEYCVIHQAEKDDRADRREKGLLAVGSVVLSVGGLVVAKGKDIIKYIPKIK